MPYYIAPWTPNGTVNPDYRDMPYDPIPGTQVASPPVNLIYDSSIQNADGTKGNVRSLTTQELAAAQAKMTPAQLQYALDVYWMVNTGVPAINAAISGNTSVPSAIQNQFMLRQARMGLYFATESGIKLPSVVLP